jgi:hypothetical protein
MLHPFLERLRDGWRRAEIHVGDAHAGDDVILVGEAGVDRAVPFRRIGADAAVWRVEIELGRIRGRDERRSCGRCQRTAWCDAPTRAVNPAFLRNDLRFSPSFCDMPCSSLTAHVAAKRGNTTPMPSTRHEIFYTMVTSALSS